MPSRTAFALAALVALGCAPAPARTPPASAAPSAAPEPREPQPSAAPTAPQKTWDELYPDAPETELKASGEEGARLRKLSVDIEVTYRELAKVAQSAPFGCPLTKSACASDWTRYVTSLAAIKQRIDRPLTSCEARDASPERALVLDHHDYQSRAYQAHVDKLLSDLGSAEAQASFKRLLEGAEKRHSTPACVEPGS